MEKKPWTRTNTVCLTIAITGLLASFILICYTNQRYPNTQTPDQRREQYRQQKLEDARAKNYVEHIKPYVPNAP